MAASKGTIEQVAAILIQEAGLIKAVRIAQRLVEETQGNQSYKATIRSLRTYLVVKCR